MSLATYTDLQTAMGNYLDRTDLSSRIPDFITLFEAKINRRLRVRQQTATATLSFTSGVATLPADFLEWKRVTATVSGLKTELEYVNPNEFDLIDQESPSAPSVRFTIEGSSLKVMPINDTATVTLLYAQMVPALASNSTNWLLTAYPDAYLYGSLAEAAVFTEDAQLGPVMDGLAKEAIGEIWGLNFANQAPAAQRVVVPTP